ncbi:hypothetical protein BYT27DRAFT_7185650 [Phlegmacium glaucopus]|nr:hypothetical protein BYT27DRAFT_7185650 [Phlegmacium glaucopus]
MSYMHKLWSWSKTCITNGISPYIAFHLCLLRQQLDWTSFVESKGSSSAASSPRTKPS